MVERPATLVELRLLDGPNLYFPRAAAKLVLDITAVAGLSSADAAAVAAALGITRVRPGEPGSGQRQRLAMRVVARLVRRLAAGAGTARLGLRVRPGAGAHEVVAAYPWRRHDRAVALGEAVARCLAELPSTPPADVPGMLEREAATVVAAPAGRGPGALRATVPVASVTGTNGKTTTTRLLAHIAMTAGLRTGWSSTDGVVVQGEVVEPGDYSGPAGARAVLTAPGVQCAVLETARGGLLLRGMGVVANDVSVVTNVSADHLGLQGIDTVDQLAEVKAIITRVTSPKGWCVLNGDDPRVLAMAAGSPARPWVFSLDAGSPALRTALDAGGRGITVLDGQLVVLRPDGDLDRLVDVLDVPMTLCGLSSHNVANALAGAAAALGLGLPRESVVEGLRTFRPDVQLNPGRLNVWSLPAGDGAVTVVVDLAHNEAGLEALLDVCEGLRAPGSLVRLGLGTAGDRTDDILRSLGRIAGRRADQVVVVHKEKYLRGRTAADLQGHLLAGLADTGAAGVPVLPDELAGLESLCGSASAGDVVALMCHEDRERLDTWLLAQGATQDGPDQVRAKVVTARGEHPLEAQIADLRERAEPDDRARLLLALLDADPDDPRLMYEWASALDAAGHEVQAVPAYETALRGGLREPHRHRAMIQLGSSLRGLGRPEEAVAVLTAVTADRPESVAAQLFLSLALLDADRPAEAVRGLVESTLAHSGDPDVVAYRTALLSSAAALSRT
ncbi:MAG TPA: tetratricopeptide repeat protein [Actinomycetales bacterium]